MTTVAKFLIRDGTPADHPYVEDFWRVYVSESYYAFGTPASVLIGKMRALLKSTTWKLIVACVPEVPEEIFGYLVYRPEPFALGWCQVKLKRRGIARLLMSAATNVTGGYVECAFYHPAAAKWLEPLGIKLRFRPYLPDSP